MSNETWPTIDQRLIGSLENWINTFRVDSAALTSAETALKSLALYAGRMEVLNKLKAVAMSQNSKSQSSTLIGDLDILRPNDPPIKVSQK